MTRGIIRVSAEKVSINGSEEHVRSRREEILERRSYLFEGEEEVSEHITIVTASVLCTALACSFLYSLENDRIVSYNICQTYSERVLKQHSVFLQAR